jgi:hypothetical protein
LKFNFVYKLFDTTSSNIVDIDFTGGSCGINSSFSIISHS